MEIPAKYKDEFKHEMEELRRKLCKELREGRIKETRISYPSDIEDAGITGILYGSCETNTYFVTSNQEKKANEIGRIFVTKPKQNLSDGITGYYENGVLKFENPDGSECEKRPYRLFKRWMKGEIDIIFNKPQLIEIPRCGF